MIFIAGSTVPVLRTTVSVLSSGWRPPFPFPTVIIKDSFDCILMLNIQIFLVATFIIDVDGDGIFLSTLGWIWDDPFDEDVGPSSVVSFTSVLVVL